MKYGFLVPSHVFQKIAVIIMRFGIVRKSFNSRSEKQTLKVNQKMFARQCKIKPIFVAFDEVERKPNFVA